MTVLGKKTKVSILIYLELVAAIVLYIMAIGSVIALAIYDALSLLVEPMILVIVGPFYLAAIFGGIWLIKRFTLYRKMPEKVIETDGEKVYLHLKEEHEFKMKDIASVFAIPESALVHLFLGGYGTVEIKLNNGKKYKILYIEKANAVPDKFGKYING